MRIAIFIPLLLLSQSLFAQKINKQELPIPTLYEGQLNDKGERVFKLNMREGKTEYFSGKMTDTLGINGNILGPTLRAKRGEYVKLEVTNSIKEASTLHWHGMHLPAKMDGGPHQVIEPSKTWVSEYEIKQPAASLWYHPHLMGKTGIHVYQGMAGMFILEDDTSEKLNLPKTYGYDDIPVIIQDRRFNQDYQLQYVQMGHDIMMGMQGNFITVNGAITPTWTGPNKLVRLRVLNGANAAIHDLGFSDNREFYQIATDGGLLEAPVKLNRIRLSAGERAEILVDLSKDLGKSLSLKGYIMDMNGNEQSYKILGMNISKEDTSALPSTIPEKLATIEWYKTEDIDNERSFAMAITNAGFTINYKTMDLNRIDEYIKLGDTERWTLTSINMFHPFHVHDIQFQIISRGGKEPHPWEKGWKDTVLLLPGEDVEILARFEDYADPDAPYMYHCHILEHEDQGMMGQFVVIP